MAIPSVKTIAKIEWLDKVGDPTAIAKQIRGLMDGSIDPMTIEATEQWVNGCYNMPSTVELKMSAINAVTECHGTEAIWLNGHSSSAYPDMEYVNVGDTYDTTIIYDYLKDKFIIGSYGDWVERNDPNY